MGENKYLVIFVHRTRGCERVSVQFNKCGAISPAFPVGSATLNEDGHWELRKNTFPKGAFACTVRQSTSFATNTHKHTQQQKTRQMKSEAFIKRNQ